MRLLVRSFFIAAFACQVASNAWGQLPFFPGAEGFGGTITGSVPTGGWLSDGSVYRVTNLNDSGPGSLRNAFVQNSTKKIIVFDVSGTIQLSSTLDIKNLSNYYIAGQTAPGPVSIQGATTLINASNNRTNSNIVLRYLSFRGSNSGDDTLGFKNGNASAPGTNMIIDHVSASWSRDEIMSVANYNTNVTVQYAMIHDALVSSHAYGSLIRPHVSANVTFHHNLYANNASRQARFGSYNSETLTADFRNNVVYNFRDRASYAGGSTPSEGREKADINYVGNYIIAGPGTTGTPNIAFSVDRNIDVRVYQSGNLVDPDDAPGGVPADGVLDGTDLGWAAFTFGNAGSPMQTLTQMTSPFAMAPVTTQTAAKAYEQIIDYVGNFWWARDAIDSRVINNVTNFTGVPLGAAAPIASELNGLLTAPMLTHPAGYDADNDGMADAWEALHGGNLVWNADFDNDGYINLIEFINEKGEFPAPAPIVFNGALNNRYAHIMNWKTDDGGITAGSNWQPSKYDLAVIKNGSVVVDAVGQHAGILRIAPDAGNNATVNITAGWLKAAEGVEVGSDVGEGKLNIQSGATLFAPVVAVGARGQLTGSGEIVGNVVNEGLVSPGNSPGTLEVSGNFAQNAGGVLKMEIASATSYDQLAIGGALMAGGTLDVDLLSYSPTAGDVFNLFDFTSSMGEFLLDLPGLATGLAWDHSNLLVSGELAVVAAGIENADFNGDGTVDGRDFLIWQRGFGNPGTLATGDANDDGLVNGIDLEIWQTQYAGLAQQTANLSIPEPSAISLLLLAGSMAGFTRTGNCSRS